ncbi:MAG: universal stress protein [Bacteroidetes bacterium]|nr:universal stress protein [Bacteroidota bacterium]
MKALKVLLPVDFSPQNEVMYQMVQQLSQYLQLEVTLIHVAPKGSKAPQQAEYARLLAAITRQAAELDAAGPTWFAKCRTETVLIPKRTHLAKQIARYADEHHFDIIFTSSKPRIGLGEYILSSLLSRIIRYSNVPILVLTPGKLPRIGRLLYATDFSPASLRALVQLAHIAPLMRAALICARINTGRDFLPTRDFQEARLQCLHTLEDNKVDHLSHPIDFVAYNARTVTQGILESAQDYLADVIVTATNARAGFNLLMNGSVTQEILEQTHLPVLIYKIQQVDEITSGYDDLEV